MEDEIDPVEPQEETSAQVPPAMLLQQLVEVPNIAAIIDRIPGDGEKDLDAIAYRVIAEHKIDEESRSAWVKRMETALDLAMLVAEGKDYPFRNAANVKYPLLTTAALQFNARAYPAIVPDNKVAKCVTWGNDPDGMKAARGERVSQHLSYQLLAEQTNWEEDTDRLTLAYSICGAYFRKVWFDPALRRNCSAIRSPKQVVVNYKAASFDDCPRITEELTLYPHEIEERVRSGRYLDIEYGDPVNDGEDETSADDDFAPHTFLEQHRLLDLDGDGYPEPYVVTVHKATEKVVRITACFEPESISADEQGNVMAIRRTQYYIRYLFWPSPDGGVYGMGLGELLGPLNETINTTLNQMLDAGHLANIQGGLVAASAGIKEKSIRLENGEWRVIKTNGSLKDSILPITYAGPSDVLFKLLGLLVEAGREVAGVKDVLTGEVRQNMTASATLALIEQGLQVYTAIYKRLHRSLKAELGIYARLNRKYVDPQEYNEFFNGQQMFDPAADYTESDKDIMPITDPKMHSRMQELAKANFLREISQDNPVINQAAVTARILEAGQVEKIEELIQPPPQPDPMVADLMQRNAEAEVQEKETKALVNEASAMEKLAKAASTEQAAGLPFAKLQLEALKAEGKMATDVDRGRMEGMAGQPGNPMGNGPAGPAGAGTGAGVEGAPLPIDAGGPGPMDEPASAGGL